VVVGVKKEKGFFVGISFALCLTIKGGTAAHVKIL